MQWLKDWVIKSPALLFSTAIWSHLAHFCLALNYLWEANDKNLEIAIHISITFPFQRHLPFLKDLFFVIVPFISVAICISVSFPLAYYKIDFPFLVFLKNYFFIYVLIVLSAIYTAGSLKKYDLKYTLQSHPCGGRLMNII